MVFGTFFSTVVYLNVMLDSTDVLDLFIEQGFQHRLVGGMRDSCIDCVPNRNEGSQVFTLELHSEQVFQRMGSTVLYVRTEKLAHHQQHLLAFLLQGDLQLILSL